MTRRLFAVLLGGLLAGPWLFIAGCTSQPEPPFRIGAIVWPGYEPFFLARALGKFEGTPVRLVEYTGTPEAIRAFRNGAIESVAVTADEFLRLASEEPDIRAVLVLDISSGADALIGKPELQSVADLKNKRVAVEVNSVGAYLLGRALEANGLETADVQIVPVDHEQHATALRDGRVDAVVAFDPCRTRLLENGYKVLFDSSKIRCEIADVLVVRRSVLEKRPATVRALIDRWFETCDFIHADRARACELMAPREKVSPGVFGRSLDRLHIPSRAENQQILVTRAHHSYHRLFRMREAMQRAGMPLASMPGPEIIEGGFVR